jgi:hypothetical protein
MPVRVSYNHQRESLFFRRLEYGVVRAPFTGLSLLSKCIGDRLIRGSSGVIIIYVAAHPRPTDVAYNRPFADRLMTNLTSDQVGLPAELKHINKRRKRN